MRKSLAFALTLLFAVAAFAQQPSTLQKVESKTVCMVNEQAMGRDQIPVEVDGRTYYGCCDMCKNRLANDPAIRVAIDPFSGAEVDKARAVIAADANGSVFYFENEDNLKKYNAAIPGAK